MKTRFLSLLLAALFLSCVNKDATPNIQAIVSQWQAIETNIENQETIALIDLFYESLIQFQQSELYRLYYSIPFFSQIKHSLTPLHIGIPIHEGNKEIEKIIENMLDYTQVLRASIIAQDMNKAQTASKDIANELILLLKIDTEVQWFISFSYFNLIITLAVFIIIIVLFAFFLYQALARSLKREDEGTKLTHTYMLAQEEERFRISRELHDTVIQDMRCVLLETEKIGVKIPMIADLIHKTRSLCNDLVPPDFRFRELPDALRQLCHEVSEKTGINCRAEIDENI